jgi:hypothetical protein
MRTFQAPARPYQPSCAHCARKVKTGEWLLEWVKNDNVSLDSKVRYVTHVRCIRRVIADVPPDGEEAFHELRQLIAATGNPFPE